MATPSIQVLITQAQQVLNLQSSNEIRATLAAVLANANVGTPLNPNLTTQQLWNEFDEIVRQSTDDILSIIVDQMMRFVYAPPAPGGVASNHEVIYNDNGVLAGDPKFLWDDALNKLDIDASATITGDLTVDTNVLKVDTTNDRVGIGTASPAYLVDVLTAGASTVNDSFNVARFTGASAVANDFSLVGPATSQVRLNFSHPTASGNGEVGYDHATNNLRFVTAGTQKGAFNATGAFILAGGEITANGTGVNFPATQAASSNANTLDDYEEGTWTPTLDSGTFSAASCRYTKIGNMVTICFDVTVGTGGGDRITNLPFVAGASTVASGIYTNAQTYAAGTTAPVVVIGGSSSIMYFRTVGTGVAFSAMTLTAAANLTGSISYFV